MRRLLVVCFLILLCVGKLESQTSVHDSLRIRLKEDSSRIYRETIGKLFLRIENRYTPILKQQVNMLGVMAGITLKHKHSFFIGYYCMLPPLIAPLVERVPLISISTQSFVEMQYGLMGYQYMLYHTRWFHLNLPLTAGLGSYHLNLNSGTEKYKGAILPFCVGLQTIFKPLTWLGLSVSGGYRYMVFQKNNPFYLHGWYYSFGIWIDGRTLGRHIRYKHKVFKHDRALKAARTIQ